MLSSCLNPACKASFRYLYDGRIFTVERLITSPDGLNTERMFEHYWLCGPCGRSLKVVVENGVPTTVPIHPEQMGLSGAQTESPFPVG
jgi:hypothetical protein